MDPTDHLVAPATRRAVVATGAKLAYAAPLVAATMPLTTPGAGAVSSQTCIPFNPVTCFGGARGCCPAAANCTTAASGQTFCIAFPVPFCLEPACTRDRDCPAGSRCGRSCCGLGTESRCFRVEQCEAGRNTIDPVAAGPRSDAIPAG